MVRVSQVLRPQRLVWLPLVAFMLVGALAPILARYGASETNLLRALEAPSSAHWLGTDQLGRDQFSRVIFAARTSLLLVSGVISISVVFGLLIGSVTGYFGGKLDRFGRWLTDFAMSIPVLILALAILGIGGGGTRNLIFALALFGWAPYARLSRNVVVANKGLLSVDASRALGASHLRLLRQHLWPLAWRPTVVYASTDVATVVLTSATFSFLGLGVAPPTPEWGQMLVDARPYLTQAWWMVIPPGLAIGLVALAANLVAETMDAPAPSSQLWGARTTPRLAPPMMAAVHPNDMSISEEAQVVAEVSPAKISQQVPGDRKRLLFETNDLAVNLVEANRAIPVVRSVSFYLKAGETLGMVGESGSGKTISSLAPWGLVGTHARVEGSSKYQGFELVGSAVADQRALLRSEVGVVFQEAKSALHPLRTIGAQLGETLVLPNGQRPSRQVRKRKGINLLGKVGLAAPSMVWGQYPHELSGGMLQRVMIAMALANEPTLLIADEPTSSLDVTTQAVIIELLANLVAEANMAMLFISHNLPVVAMLADEVVTIADGVSSKRISTRSLLRQYLDAGLIIPPKYPRLEPASEGGSTRLVE